MVIDKLMTGDLQIILLIVSSILGYLARMKIKSKCGSCCECEIERDDNNKVKRVSVVKKTRENRSQRNLDTHQASLSREDSQREDTINEPQVKSRKQQSGTL
jgi:hypothetical protein